MWSNIYRRIAHPTSSSNFLGVRGPLFGVLEFFRSHFHSLFGLSGLSRVAGNTPFIIRTGDGNVLCSVVDSSLTVLVMV